MAISHAASHCTLAWHSSTTSSSLSPSSSLSEATVWVDHWRETTKKSRVFFDISFSHFAHYYHYPPEKEFLVRRYPGTYTFFLAMVLKFMSSLWLWEEEPESANSMVCEIL